MTDNQDDPLPARIMQSRLVDVGDYCLFATCGGQGRPTVVLEAGAGCDSSTWDALQASVMQFTHVCSYDRAGLGKSQRGPRPRTTQAMADDVHTLLLNAEIPGPYVLVGHSVGGLIVRLYAHCYPDEVVGLVLIDVPHPHQGVAFRRAVDAETVRTNPVVQGLLTASRGGDPDAHPEGLDFAASLTEVRNTDNFESLPVVILTRHHSEGGSVLLEKLPELPADVAAAFEQVWHNLQADLVRRSSNSTQIIAEQRGHFVHRDQPQLVLDAIRQVVETVRRGV